MREKLTCDLLDQLQLDLRGFAPGDGTCPVPLEGLAVLLANFHFNFFELDICLADSSAALPHNYKYYKL